MTRAGRALGWLICISGCVALTRRGGDPAAPFTPGKEGWLTLFDGSDMAKWEKAKESDWALKKGVLVGAKGEMVSRWHWTDFEMAATVRGRGALRFRVSLAPMPEQAGYALSLVDGTLRKDAVDGPVLQTGRSSAVKGWRDVRVLVSKGSFTVHLDGHESAKARDSAYPAMGYLAFVPEEGERLEIKRLRVRPLNREKYDNVPAPNSACFVCHANFEKDRITTKHVKKDVLCATCHGPSLAHRSDEDNVTTPDIMFTRGEVDAACLKCHKLHEREKHKKSSKGKPPPNPICTDCHGSHKGRN